jgi:hypothetical protein
VTQEPTIVVSHRLPVDDAESDARWVVVPSALWTTTPEVGDLALPFRVPHPFGSADNRLLRTRDRQARNRQLLADHANFRWVTEAWPSGLSWQARRTGNVMARPAGSGRVQLEVLR